MSRSPSARPTARLRFTLFLLLVAIGSVCFAAAAHAAPITYSTVASWGATGAGNGQFTTASGVDVDPFGRVLVSEYTGHRMQWFGRDGSPWYQTMTGCVNGPTYGWIGGVWIDERTADTYVGDTQLHKIHRVQPGNYFGNDIGGNTQWSNDRFVGIRGVALDPWGTVYGSDPDSATVRAFSPEGLFQGLIGSSAPANGGLNFPYGVDWDYDGRLYVASMNSARVCVYGPDRSFESSWLASVQGICVDPGGNLFVTQGQKVSRFTTEGVFLDSFGSAAVFSSLSAVRDDGARHLYATDAVLNKVTEFSASVPTTYVVTAGASRYDTALKISRAAYPRGLTDPDPWGRHSVVVATGENWPDALGASALAGAANGPILIVKKDSQLPMGLDAELVRLGAKCAYIVGGPGAVTTETVNQIVDAMGAGAVYERIAGSSRYETSRLVAQRVASWGFQGTAFVATGAGFADALSASPLAAAKQWPVFLADPDESFVASMTALGFSRAIILGGTGAVPDSAEDSLRAELGDNDLHVLRWAGNSRYETSSLVASNALDPGLVGTPMRANRVALATGQSFPDGLAGGVLQAKSWGPMLLTQPTTLTADARSWLAARKDKVYHVRFLGGDNAISQAVRNEFKPPLLW